MEFTIGRFVRALGLGAAVLAAGETLAAPPASGTVNSNLAAGSNAASDGSVNANVAGGFNSAAPNGGGPANGMGSGAVGIATNGLWPYGVAPNGNESGVMTAQPAPAVPNPALYPNVYTNGTRENSVMTARPAPAVPNPALHPNGNSNGNLNSNGGANVNPNMNQSNRAGAWRGGRWPRAAQNGFGARNYNLQSFSQFNNYGGRTFARGNPQYFGIRRYYANGNYFSSFRANQGR